MKAIFDGNIIDPKNLNHIHENRGFLYGDGLFETILFSEGRIKYLPEHVERVKDGCLALSLSLPDYFNARYLNEQILRLINMNGFTGSLRIKLLVWRRQGGLYEPENNKAHHLLLVHEGAAGSRGTIRRAGFSTRVYNHYSPWSAFKTQSSVSYVLAGIEKKEKAFDDIIISDIQENISELLYSNIFWIANDTFYTPALETGCIRGVMRTCLIRKLKAESIPIHEVIAAKNILLDADHVFSANVRGLASVTGIEDRSFTEYPDLARLLP